MSDDNGVDSQKHWDPNLEKISLREEVRWLEHGINKKIVYEKMLQWTKWGPRQFDVDNETAFVDKQVLKELLDAKYSIFTELNSNDLRKARSRANVFETIRNGFFMNRAALKMANIDALTDFMFTRLDYDSIHKRQDGPYYFADVCAGPGGFTEYILWRKKWCYKGFGFTLKGEHDFKLHDSTCVSSNSFRPYYGCHDDGNIYNPDNIDAFKEIIENNTQGGGVHFMMSDGGFSVEGNENLQEVLSKQLYVCQCLMALEIIRPHGYFVTKMFDLFTCFSVGLIFLMYLCFEKITIVKPNSSRPANAERYLICKGLRAKTQTHEVRKYLKKIVQDLWVQKESPHQDSDILELVPVEILKLDQKFSAYMFESNTTIAKRQIVGLKKLKSFCQNADLIEPRQEIYKAKCLELWQIPNIKRSPTKAYTIDDIVNTISQPEFMLTQPREIHDASYLKAIIDDVNEWMVAPLASSNSCSIYAGVSNSKVLKLVGNRWIKTRNIRLNRGTLLYGEMVKEKCISMREGTETEKLSLHVIDALRLGETSLADLSFPERVVCINTFCQAVNFEHGENTVRIRLKLTKPLKTLHTENLIEYDNKTCEYITHLAVVGAGNSDEYHSVNSLLFLKISSYQIFNSTYVLRVLVDISKHNANNHSFSLSELIDNLKSFNKE